MEPRISIVIPVYNEEDTLADCLASLQEQEYCGLYEIIVVNNGCTDRSPDIAQTMGVRVVDEPKKGYVHALRAGFAAARGDIVACTDADSFVRADWLSRIETTFATGIVPVAMTGVFDFHDGPHWLRWVGARLSRLNRRFLIGTNMAIRRDAYEQLGGFDPRVNLGTDTNLGIRLRRIGRIKIDPRCVVFTSSRRFQVSFLRSMWLYAINIVWLSLFRRPYRYDFPDIRIPVRSRLSRWRLLRAKTFGPVIARCSVPEPVVALTFDDGPSPYTAPVLDILARYQIKATFFVIGENALRYPAMVKRAVKEGHAIGNHTNRHLLWAALRTSHTLEEEIDRASSIIQSMTGSIPTLFRPPQGVLSPWLVRLVNKKGYAVVTWSVSPHDWLRPPPSTGAIVNRIMRRVEPGAIILLHDGLETDSQPNRKNTVRALPLIIEKLHNQGYRFVTVKELIDLSDYDRNL